MTSLRASDKSDRVSPFERLLAAAILFYGAMLFCLPVPPSEEIAAVYPWWGKRIAIGNLQLYELLFMLWLVLYGRRFVPRALLNAGVPARQAALCLVALAVWCGLISLLAPLPLLDLGRTFRLLLNAALLLAVIRWTRQTGDFPLAAVISGFLVGTIVNLILSFRYPLIVLETMRLSGQNTPGVAMAVGMHLCAWMFLRTNRFRWRALAMIAAVVFAFGCAISYSRIGWFVGACGGLACCYVLIAARPREQTARRRLRRIRFVAVPLLAFVAIALATSPLGQQGLQWIQTLAEQKIEGRSEGDANRWAYVLGTAEIMSQHPFGVGYSGFFDAMTATDTYRSGLAAEEVSPIEANPHATFLWYASAGGLPGALLGVLLCVFLLHSLRCGLQWALGRPGQVLAVLAALPFLLIGMTVTYLFNSIILIVPAAIAAGWGWSWNLQPSTKQRSVAACN